MGTGCALAGVGYGADSAFGAAAGPDGYVVLTGPLAGRGSFAQSPVSVGNLPLDLSLYQTSFVTGLCLTCADMPEDSDGDGWRDAFELMLGTDPHAYTSHGIGDLNGDGEVNASDVRCVRRWVGKNGAWTEDCGNLTVQKADLNCDGKVSGKDIALATKLIQACDEAGFCEAVWPPSVDDDANNIIDSCE